ncbi:hypothetical protein [Ruegeria arenilitoris]|uniref:hypothetical protein n=1 Tax=Ruegeria arenilitoris TaxID=1173585 RepID=UPI00147DDCB3|nr:hypothetical protein [Ruegeria arenilitoris]
MPWILDVQSANIRLGLEGGYSNEYNPIDSHCLSGFVADVPPELLPFRLDIWEAPNPLPEFANYCYTDIYVGETARRLIEELEPSTHQFHDTIVTRNGKPVTGRPYRSFQTEPPFFRFGIGGEFFRFQLGAENVLDGAIVIEESDVAEWHRKLRRKDGSIAEIHSLAVKARPPRLKWRRSVVLNRHLWIEKRLTQFLIASDELYSAFKSAGVTGFNAQECRFAENA